MWRTFHKQIRGQHSYYPSPTSATVDNRISTNRCWLQRGWYGPNRVGRVTATRMKEADTDRSDRRPLETG
jgi:hypothetical protein